MESGGELVHTLLDGLRLNRHCQLRRLHDAFKSILDPDTDAAANIKGDRVWGPDYPDAKPPQANKLARRYRTWMVDEEVLRENPNWVMKGRVAASGADWGEEEPIEDSRKRNRDEDDDEEEENQRDSKRFQLTLVSMGKDMESAAEGSKALVERYIKTQPIEGWFPVDDEDEDDDMYDE